MHCSGASLVSIVMLVPDTILGIYVIRRRSSSFIDGSMSLRHPR